MRLSLLSRAALAAPVTPALSDGNTGIDLHLVGLEGREIAWNAALRLEADTLSGAAPVNRFFAANASELPEISFSALALAMRLAIGNRSKRSRSMTRCLLLRDQVTTTGGR